MYEIVEFRGKKIQRHPLTDELSDVMRAMVMEMCSCCCLSIFDGCLPCMKEEDVEDCFYMEVDHDPD